MLHFRLDSVGTSEPRWGSSNTPISVRGTTADGDGGVHLHVTGLRPFVTVALPVESPPFDEERTDELTALLAPVLSSAAGYRGQRFKLSFCTQALEQTRVDYEQPPGPARTLRIIFNCSTVAAEVARVLQAPEAAATGWTYPRSIDAASLLDMLGDARGGIRVLDPDTAHDSTSCFAARTGVARLRWCAADTAWPDVEHEHDRPVTLELEQFRPTAAPTKRKRNAESNFATCVDHLRSVDKAQLALLSDSCPTDPAIVARRAFDERLEHLFEAVLRKNPRLHALFSEAELRNATIDHRRDCKDRRVTSPFVSIVADAQYRKEVKDVKEIFDIAKFESTEAAFRFAFKTGKESDVESMLKRHPSLHESITERELRVAQLNRYWWMASLVLEAKETALRERV